MIAAGLALYAIIASFAAAAPWCAVRLNGHTQPLQRTHKARAHRLAAGRGIHFHIGSSNRD